MRTASCLVACVLAFAPVRTWAQTPSAPTEEPKGSGEKALSGDLTFHERSEITAGALTRASGVTSTSAVKAAPLFSFEATKGEKKVTGQVGFQLGDFTLTVGASANIDDSTDGPTDLADLSGLANKATGTFSALWSHWSTGGNPVALLKSICQKYAEAIGRNVNQIECTPEGIEADDSDAAKEALKAILRNLHPGIVYFAGVDAKAAPETFKYVTDASKAAVDLSDPDSKTNITSEKHTSWSIGASAGFVLPWDTTIAGILTREVSYSEGTKGQLCQTNGQNGISNCFEKVLAPPKAEDPTYLLGIEFKQFFGGMFAVAPRISHDFTRPATLYEVPIYFLKDKTGGFNGGIKLSYRDDKRQFNATAFVSEILGLITAPK